MCRDDDGRGGGEEGRGGGNLTFDEWRERCLLSVLSMLLLMGDGRWLPMLVRGAMEEEEESQAAAETLLLMCWLGTGRSIPRRRRDGDLTVGL